MRKKKSEFLRRKLLISFIRNNRSDLVATQKLRVFHTWLQLQGVRDYPAIGCDEFMQTRLHIRPISSQISTFRLLIHLPKFRQDVLFEDLKFIKRLIHRYLWLIRHGYTEYRIKPQYCGFFFKRESSALDLDFAKVEPSVNFSKPPQLQELNNLTELRTFFQNKEVKFIGYPGEPLGLGNDLDDFTSAVADYCNSVSTLSIRDQKIGFEAGSNCDAWDRQITFIVMSPTEALLAIISITNYLSKTLIIFTPWEFKKVPKFVALFFPIATEIWTPSTIALGSFRKHHRAVRHVRTPITARIPEVLMNSNSNQTMPSDYFLTFIDGNSSLERKGTIDAILAFNQIRTTPDDKPYKLIVKCHNLSDEQRNKLKSICNENSRVVLVDEVWSRSKVLTTMKNSTGVISLHRSEGFGRVLVEAALLNVSVVATDYSLPLEVLTYSKLHRVNFKLVKVHSREYSLAAGYLWAQPDRAHASQVIYSLIQNSATKHSDQSRPNQCIR